MDDEIAHLTNSNSKPIINLKSCRKTFFNRAQKRGGSRGKARKQKKYFRPIFFRRKLHCKRACVCKKKPCLPLNSNYYQDAEQMH